VKIFIWFIFLLITVTAGAQVIKPGSQDHYQNFAEIAQKNKEGRDYLIEVSDRESGILVMAFHGGFIEPGTTELAKAIAGAELSFYGFSGLIEKETDEASYTSSLLHLTSARFDEPKLMSLTKKKEFCLAIHGFGGAEGDFCVGGANAEQRKIITEQLSKAFPDFKSCELCCNPFNGTSLENPVNHCLKRGVQIELSPGLRRKILKDSEFKNEIGMVLRKILTERKFI
jgi:phage replication-related protein YjqB (UPF0714/DUF867 family)